MHNLFTDGSHTTKFKSLLPSFISNLPANKTNFNKLNDKNNQIAFLDLCKKQINDDKINRQKTDKISSNNIEALSKTGNKSNERTQIKNSEQLNNHNNKITNKKENENEKSSKLAEKNKEIEKNKENEENEKIEVETSSNTKIISDKEDIKDNDVKKTINKYLKEINNLLAALESHNPDNKVIIKLEKLLKDLTSKLLKLFNSKENKYKHLFEKSLLSKLQSIITLIDKKLSSAGKFKNSKNPGSLSNLKNINLKTDNLFTLNLKQIKNQIEKLSKRIAKNTQRISVSQISNSNNPKEQITINQINSDSGKLVNSESNLNNLSSNNENDSNSFQFSREFQNTSNQNNIGKNSLPQGAAAKGGLFDEQLKEIINKSRMVVKDEKNASMSLKLNPKNLGKVNINLGLENGQLSGKFLVDSQEAKNTLLESLETLKEHLSQNGISIGEFQVNVREQKHFFSNTNENEITHLNSKKDNNISISNQYDQHASLHNGQIDMVI